MFTKFAVLQFGFSVLLSATLFSYEGQREVDDLFSQVSDLKHPTLQDYQKIQDFLLHSERPYLKPLEEDEIVNTPTNRKSSLRRIGRSLKLVGDEGQMPYSTIYHLDDHPSDRCILLYASFNPPYPEKTQTILSELKAKGYRGDVLMRIGGYPNLENGGLELCHIPYAWKVAFLKEAMGKGYRNILWIDTSMHPLNNLEEVFQILEENGYLFMTVDGGRLDYGYRIHLHLPNAINTLNISLDHLGQIHHLAGCLIGINTANSRAISFIEKWYEKTKEVTPCITWYPEELSYSVIAWQHQLYPLMRLNRLVSQEKDIPPYCAFFLDSIR